MHVRTLIGILAVAIPVVACTPKPSESPQLHLWGFANSNVIVARAGAVEITAAQLEAATTDARARAQQQYYAALERELSQLLTRRLLEEKAAAQNQSVEAYLEGETRA